MLIVHLLLHRSIARLGLNLLVLCLLRLILNHASWHQQAKTLNKRLKKSTKFVT